MLSYAQNSEDVLLSRIFKGESGTYVDVGACHPVIDSVTYAFYKRGWTGINFEPTLTMFERLEAVRPRDNNLNLAVSNENGRGVFYECPSHLPLSTMNAVVAEEIRQSGGLLEERPIQVQTLSAALTELGKPRGRGGPWLDTETQASTPSEPYLMTGYDHKQLTLTAENEVAIDKLLQKESERKS